MARLRPRCRWNLRWHPTPLDRHRPGLPATADRLPEATHIPRSLR
jgi:hypothetical protein